MCVYLAAATDTSPATGVCSASDGTLTPGTSGGSGSGSSPPPSSSSSSSSGSLSPLAVTGIVVGGLVGALACIALYVYLKSIHANGKTRNERQNPHLSSNDNAKNQTFSEMERGSLPMSPTAENVGFEFPVVQLAVGHYQSLAKSTSVHSFSEDPGNGSLQPQQHSRLDRPRGSIVESRREESIAASDKTLPPIIPAKKEVEKSREELALLGQGIVQEPDEINVQPPLVLSAPNAAIQQTESTQHAEPLQKPQPALIQQQQRPGSTHVHPSAAIYQNQQQHQTTCLECEAPITSVNPGFMLTEAPLTGAWFHDACFKCDVCLLPFTEERPFVPFNNRAYCEEHFKAQLAATASASAIL